MTMKNLMSVAAAMFALAGCVGMPEPEFARTTNLRDVPWVEVRLAGDMQTYAIFEQCPGRSFAIMSCEETCGVVTHVFSNRSYNYQDTLRMASNELRLDLDRARNAGCFEYGVPTNITYRRGDVTPSSSELRYITITETFFR